VHVLFQRIERHRSKVELDALKTIVETSQGLSAWAVTVAGGSLVVILSTGYLKPKNYYVRLAYLLYFPGWVFLGLSVYYGQLIQRRYIVALLIVTGQVKGNLDKIAQAINSHFGLQFDFFKVALVFFGIWLVIFLLWWIFCSSGETKGGQSK
jgi:hypothetical protein